MAESIIRVLDSQTANLIAAGEVVDRPASVVKELVENAIDAGATSVTVEIRGGGSSLIRVTDNGKGMSAEDVKVSVKRHATSKIQKPSDLDAILTLGFRGEALAAISSVAKFSILSRRRGDEMGYYMEMEGEKRVAAEEVGAPEGTTVRVESLFFNQPARKKFLKRDATETAAVCQLTERVALSHPEVSIQLIADGVRKFQSPGDGDLKQTIYSVLGREFADGMLPLSYEENGVSVSGYLCRPEFAKPNRILQCYFINGRYVRSKTCMVAMEDAHKSYMQSDKFPACVLFLTIDPARVDVNVHPAKLEVRFGDERMVYNAVYCAVKNALAEIKNPLSERKMPESVVWDLPQKNIEQMAFAPEKPIEAKFDSMAKPFSAKELFAPPPKQEVRGEIHFSSPMFQAAAPRKEEVPRFAAIQKTTEIPLSKTQEEKIERQNAVFSDYTVVGLLFRTYILVEAGQEFYLIDKHAAHERLLYESFCKSRKLHQAPRQPLLSPITVTLSPTEYDALAASVEEVEKTGFSIEPFGDGVFAVRALPIELTDLSPERISDMLRGMATDLASGGRASARKEEALDRALYTAACRAAVKAGSEETKEEMKELVDSLLAVENVAYCPHGRPVMVKLTKQQIEKMFSRL